MTDRPAAEWAALVRAVLGTEYPYSTQHASGGPDDVDVTPQRLHPAFHGCFDWHSSVHMHWSLVRLLDDLDGADADAATALLDARLTAPNVAVEAAYLREHPSWERPYGWAWAAMLAAACAGSAHPHAPAWAAATRPLYDAVADLVPDWLARQAYPIRHGDHPNSAFGMALVRDASLGSGRADVVAAIDARAQEWFGADADYPAHYEPSGSDFLSPALTEVALMQRVLPTDAFAAWLAAFLPDLGPGHRLLEVPEVRDPTDGHLVHLYGLALSRAWVLRTVAAATADENAVRSAADELEAFARDAVVHGDFMSTHWLVSFALLADDAA